MIPAFVANTLRRVQSEATPNKAGLGLPQPRRRNLGPFNFNRLWRRARGEKFAWVTPKTFHKTVATLIADEFGLQAAARQLGHANESVTRRHYVDLPTQAPDFTTALDRLDS
ncbi:hypothetical protein [Nocardia sp. NPDC056952]|uniref:hypothetical protein n=1 Tax=unclassified Nocardia TaxID=2637762 RepID=UPI00363241E5